MTRFFTIALSRTKSDMQRGYRYRIYPTVEQEDLLAKTFGCVRYVYNWGLNLKSELWKDEHKSIGVTELINRMASELKPEHEWLSEVNSQSLQYVLRQLATAYDNFFKGHNKYPKFKSKSGMQRFNCPQHCRVDFRKGILEIPKFTGKNALKCKFHRKFQGKIGRVTITKECDGRYYASILVDDNCGKLPKRPITPDTTMGIDTGIKSFAILSTGESFPSPHFSKNESAHMKRLQQSLSRKEKGSANFRKAKMRVARLHSKIAHRRSDFINKLTYRLTHESQVNTLCVEDLNIAGMVKNRHLAYSIEDASLGEFYRQLEYKSDWYGVNYQKIDRFAPSSKLCHVCGYKKANLKLSIRKWTCPDCGTCHDRDINAAINIKNFGLKALLAEREDVKPVEKPTMDDRSARQNLRSRASKKQEKSRGVSLEASESLA